MVFLGIKQNEKMLIALFLDNIFNENSQKSEIVTSEIIQLRQRNAELEMEIQELKAIISKLSLA